VGLTVMPAEIRDRLASTELTYSEVGETAGDLPDGYYHLTRRHWADTSSAGSPTAISVGHSPHSSIAGRHR